MDKKKKDEPIDKLEKEFRDFQKEWKKFLTNDFHRLVVNVNTLLKQNDGIRQDMTTMSQNIITLQNTVRAVDESIITLLKRVPM